MSSWPVPSKRSQQNQFPRRNIDTTSARVLLVEAGPRLLAALPEKLGQRAFDDLEKMGVQVRLNCRVDRISEGLVSIDDEQLPAENIIWAAGVRGADIELSPGCEKDRQGRIVVSPDLSIPYHPEVFVVGDLAHAHNKKDGKPIPGVAPAAIQMGRYAARIIARELTEQTTTEERVTFVYHDKGSMATIGRNRAVAHVAGGQFGGLAAWLLWGFVHILPLVGFRSKLSVLFSWMWSYVSISKNCRLITGQPEMKVKQVLRKNVSTNIKINDRQARSFKENRQRKTA